MKKIVDLTVVGESLRSARKKKGLSQLAVAHIINMSERELGNIENGRTEPEFNTLVTLCKVYGISIDVLVEVSTIIPVET